ncbi:uncharacterized protein LOC127869125 [Dreissena polymorpha]|uniref:uncharacterized protein LOC127869125 n=1 Tax=Dreissena polymorpha TaxID=45954 RepID=UPI002264E3AC|nr:uncharacterized protein LOC127869125 [Dreissena polymorpha]
MAEKCPVLATSSDLMFDYSCIICEENDLSTEAEFHCEQCSKRYCGNCLALHNQLYKKHSVTGREKMDKWNWVRLEQCEEHPTETFTVYCEDHSKMLCQKCHVYNHQKCTEVTLIADKVQDLHQKGVFKTISKTIQTNQEQLNKKIQDMKDNIDSLQVSYTNIIQEINTVHRQLVTALHKLQMNTIKEVKTLLEIWKSSLQSEIDKASKVSENTQYVQDNMGIMLGNKSKARSYIMYLKCLDQSKETAALLAPIKTLAIEFTVHKNIEQFLLKQTALGILETTFAKTKNDAILENIRMEEKQKKDYFMYNVKTCRDSHDCWIAGICETPNGELLITDRFNNTVKLLDQSFNVLNHLKLTTNPISICNTYSNNFAVAAVDNYLGKYNIHFIRVTNGKLVHNRTLNPQHSCRGITHHQENLYITSGDALYNYTVEGRLVRKVYEDTSGSLNVGPCAVSPDGDRLYVVDHYRFSLLTLAINRTVLSRLKHPPDWDVCVPPGLHVTDSGEVHISVVQEGTILQVDRDGRQVLADVIEKNDGVYRPTCVYIRKNYTRKIEHLLIVGMSPNDNIMVFKDCKLIL